MVSHYGLKEIWLGGDYPDPSKKPAGENGAESETKESVAPLHWEKPTRSGVFTVKEAEVSRVNAYAMQRHAKANIFISENFYTADRVLIIVQGSGAVRPGQWARALCINNSLKAGTIFDYLDIARECNLGVIVLNPNQDRIRLRVISDQHPNGVFHPDHAYPILGHEDHIKHIVYVHDHFIAKTAAKDLFMVAHSRGGSSALHLLNNRLDKDLISSSSIKFVQEGRATEEEIKEGRREKNRPNVGTISADEAKEIAERRRRAESDDEDDAEVDEVQGDNSELRSRLTALAFTDSVHWIGEAQSSDVSQWLDENAKDWVASKEPLDTEITGSRDNAGCECVSAGHPKHEWTSPCAVNSVFDFFFSTITNPPHFAPRQVPFSNPPQNIPIPVGEDNEHPSYAQIAARKVTPPASSNETSPTQTSPVATAAHPSYAAVAAGEVHPVGSAPTAPEEVTEAKTESTKPSTSAAAAAAANPEHKPVEAHPSYAAVAAGEVHPVGSPPAAQHPVKPDTTEQRFDTSVKHVPATTVAEVPDYKPTEEHPSYAAVAAGEVHPAGSPPSAPEPVAKKPATKPDTTAQAASSAPATSSAPTTQTFAVPSPSPDALAAPSNPSAAAAAANSNNSAAPAPSTRTVPTKPTPTPTPKPDEESGWGTIALAVAAGVIGIAAVAYVFRSRFVRK